MFVRYISHELRTPLNIISIGLQLLKKEILYKTNNPTTNSRPFSSSLKEIQDSELEIIDDVTDSCNVARWVLDDLLDYDDFDRGAVMLEFQDCEIQDLILGSAKPFVIQVPCFPKAFLRTVGVFDVHRHPSIRLSSDV